MINQSKVRDPRCWKKWYSSGAVAQKQYPPGSLVIDAIGHSDFGDTCFLTLGRQPDLSGYSPLCFVMITSPRKYRLGDILDALPKNAVPVY